MEEESMMEETTVFPEWLNGLLLPDATFASAYAAVSSQQRALFKTAIARAHAILGPQRDRDCLTSRSLRQGVDVAISTAPASCAVVLFDSDSSPAFVLAALVPAFLAGVPEVLAVHVGDDAPSKEMLTALELAGQEDVAVMDADRCFELLAETDAADGLRVCVAGSQGASCVPIPEVAGLALWRAPVPGTLGVWLGDHADDEEGVDADAIAFCHPHVALDLCHASEQDDGPLFEDFLARHDVVFVPEQRLVQSLPWCSLVLGPGEESAWLWPDLSVEFFLLFRFGISRSA